jgi:hypothetical protein
MRSKLILYKPSINISPPRETLFFKILKTIYKKKSITNIIESGN